MAANGVEISRADTKASVLLGFMGALLGAFVTVTRFTAGAERPDWPDTVMWWSALATALLAVIGFVCALAPRRRGGRGHAPAGPVYFEHVRPGADGETLHLAFQRLAYDPTGPLLASLHRTSEIIRVKYRWIEIGTCFLLAALPQLALGLAPG